jgi:plastocyanin
MAGGQRRYQVTTAPISRCLWARPLLALILCLLETDAARAETHQVIAADFEFIPRILTIAPGDTVEWIAVAPDHTVTSDTLVFDSGPDGTRTIPQGETFSHTFANTGNYPYYCRLHGAPGTFNPAPLPPGAMGSVPDDQMTGLIRVIEPGSNNPPSTPVPVAPGSGATGLSISPLLEAGPFSDPDSGDLHAASQWLVRSITDGATAFDSGPDPVHKLSIRISGLAASTTYQWQVRYRDDREAWSEYSSPSIFTTAQAVAAAGAGLSGIYFKYNVKNGTSTPVATRTDAMIDFDWRLGKPHPSAPANHFKIEWNGFVLPQFSETYRFRVRADGGVRLWVDNELIIDDWVAGPFALYRSGLATLEDGILAPIRIEYFDTTRHASIKLRWSSPSQPVETIPQVRLLTPQP